MDIVSKVLFGIANSLLIPDIILLIYLFVNSLILLGKFYSQFITKRKLDKSTQTIIDNFSIEYIDKLEKSLPQKDIALVVPYIREMLTNYKSEDYGDYLIGNFENLAAKDLSRSRILTKIGPVLGLVGTLIAMSPALVGLSNGDIAGMAYNMQVVFATTVVGLVVSGIGLVTLLYKQRWYEKDINNLIYISRVLSDRDKKTY